MSPSRNRGSDRFVTAAAQNTPEERVKASQVVIRRALSREDLQELLDMFGLNHTTSKDSTS
ncbi:hypothetical protein [Streptomyces sp. NPDC048663]|uniref:hypothetical protein n=1 Tax=Streptomyces sp. NPDC048663 TaxID=3155638 RepID=UPI003428EC4B